MRKRITKVCKQCHAEYLGTLKNKYCSDKCKMKAYRARIAQKETQRNG